MKEEQPKTKETVEIEIEARALHYIQERTRDIMRFVVALLGIVVIGGGIFGVSTATEMRHNVDLAKQVGERLEKDAAEKLDVIASKAEMKLGEIEATAEKKLGEIESSTETKLSEISAEAHGELAQLKVMVQRLAREAEGARRKSEEIGARSAILRDEQEDMRAAQAELSKALDVLDKFKDKSKYTVLITYGGAWDSAREATVAITEALASQGFRVPQDKIRPGMVRSVNEIVYYHSAAATVAEGIRQTLLDLGKQTDSLENNFKLWPENVPDRRFELQVQLASPEPDSASG